MSDDYAIQVPSAALERLVSVYEEVMWLARRPHTAPSAARAWYTHVAAVKLSRHVRMFSGKVSRAAAANDGPVLRLEHFKRIQTTITQLVERHLHLAIDDAAEFVRTVVECEQVHVVTFHENYAARSALGDYDLARIELLNWSSLPADTRERLWRTVLRNRVANASRFAPGIPRGAP